MHTMRHKQLLRLLLCAALLAHASAEASREGAGIGEAAVLLIRVGGIAAYLLLVLCIVAGVRIFSGPRHSRRQLMWGGLLTLHAVLATISISVAIHSQWTALQTERVMRSLSSVPEAPSGTLALRLKELAVARLLRGARRTAIYRLEEVVPRISSGWSESDMQALATLHDELTARWEAADVEGLLRGLQVVKGNQLPGRACRAHRDADRTEFTEVCLQRMCSTVWIACDRSLHGQSCPPTEQLRTTIRSALEGHPGRFPIACTQFAVSR